MQLKLVRAGVVVLGLISGIAMADPSPCEQIQTACGEAGFTRDLPDGRDLMIKCFQPILKGQDVKGVLVDPDTVKKCREQQNQKPKQKRKHKHSLL